MTERALTATVALGLAYIAFSCVAAGDYLAFLFGLLFVTLAGIAMHLALWPRETA